MPRNADPAVATAVRVVRALALLAIGVIAVVLLVERGDDEPGVARAAEEATLAGPGQPVADVLADRAGALAAADGRLEAAVSLVSYRSAEGLERVASRGRVAPAALLVAVPGGEPDVVEDPAQLADWIARRRAELEGERAALAEVAATVEPDDPFADTYARDIRRLDDVIAVLDADAEVVYGFLTEASAETLRGLAARADVRMVDVGPALEAGLRPEELETTGEPAARPF